MSDQRPKNSKPSPPPPSGAPTRPSAGSTSTSTSLAQASPDAPPDPDAASAPPSLEALPTARVGKIARLPKPIREELNRRLLAGEPGKQLVRWLNQQPEVQTVLQTSFDGIPISEPNLSNWKSGGFRDWLAHQQVLQRVRSLSENVRDLAPGSPPRLLSQLLLHFVSGWLLDLAPLARPDPTAPPDLQRLRQLAAMLTDLLRADTQAGRLQLLRDQLATQQRRHRYQVFRERHREPTLADYRAIFGIPDPEDTLPPPPNPSLPPPETTDGLN